MKKIFYIIGISLLAVFFTACDKDTEDISFVTNYAVLTMEGDQYIGINKGEAFVDPGVTSMIGDQPGEVIIKGTVNTEELGVYRIDYSSTNSDGFTAYASRYVIVMDIPSIEGNDFSGSYERTFYGSARSGTFSEWTATGKPGIYKVNDPGGTDTPGFEYDVYVINIKDNLIIFPENPGPLGPIFGTSTKEGTTPDFIEMSPEGKYIWSIKGSPNYGTNLRTFEKR